MKCTVELMLLVLWSYQFCGAQSRSGDATTSDYSSCETLYLLHLYPAPLPDNVSNTAWDKGLEMIPAGRIAVNQINNRSDILQNYKLEIIDIPSEDCGKHIIVEGLVGLYEQIVGPKRACIVGVVGLYCSSVTNAIAPIINHSKINFVQLASSTSLPHRDTERFPHLFHTVASSKIFNRAVVAMMNEFTWTNISSVYSSTRILFRTTSRDFVTHAQMDGKSVNPHIPITKKDQSVSEMFQQINKAGARIAYFSATQVELARILCEALKKGFVSSNYLELKYVYIIHDYTIDIITSDSVVSETKCTREEIHTAFEGIFLLHYRLFRPNDTNLISDVTYRQYYDLYKEEIKKFSTETERELEDNLYANTFYDQVWALALALNNALGNNLQSAQKEHIQKALVRELKNNSFNGTSGFVDFSKGQEVQTAVSIYQVQNGKMVLIGIYDNEGIKFMNNFDAKTVPSDTWTTRNIIIPLWLGIGIIVLDIALLLLILFHILSIIYWRKQPEIKSTSIGMSLLILTGCNSLCFSVMLTTILELVNNSGLYVLCHFEVWLSINGINLIFIILFLRLLRIFHIFRSYRSTGKYWSDRYLLLYIVLICSVMNIVLVAWTTEDPLELKTGINTEAQVPFYYQYCNSKFQTVFLGITSSWFAVLMTLLTFLSIQTRHIKRKHYKDTKKVLFFVFGVMITMPFCVTLLLIYFRMGSVIVIYVCKCLPNLVIVALCQAFLFLPKIAPLYFSRKNNYSPSSERTSRKYSSSSERTSRKYSSSSERTSRKYSSSSERTSRKYSSSSERTSRKYSSSSERTSGKYSSSSERMRSSNTQL